MLVVNLKTLRRHTAGFQGHALTAETVVDCHVAEIKVA